MTSIKDNGFTNKLNELIRVEQAKKMIAKNGEKVLLQSVTEEIAEYCHVSTESIKQYKKGFAFPSLPIAFRLAEYFRVRIEDIFSMVDYEKALGDKMDNGNNKGRGRKKMDSNRNCSICGSDKVLAKGLCQKHYHSSRTNK